MRSLPKHTVSELVDLLRQGDLCAFDELYHRFLPRVLGFAKTFITEQIEAEEAVQEVFIKIWEKRTSLNTELNFKSYLFVAVKNQIYNKLRDAQKFVRVEDLEVDIANNAIDAYEQLSYKELEETAYNLLEQLPNVQRKVYTLNKFEGLSHKEIASKLNISIRTVEHHIYLASKHLKGMLLKHASAVTVFFMILVFG